MVKLGRRIEPPKMVTIVQNGDNNIDPRANVMITIFCDLCPIFGGKMGVFLQNQCCDQIFAKSFSSLSKKRHFFAKKLV
jgi:hypothetical protein